MSKAFTRETEQDDDEDIGLPALPSGTRNYITPAGYARLRAELLNLIDNERPQVVEVVHWAASNGDRSENGDYLYGKKRLREILAQQRGLGHFDASRELGLEENRDASPRPKRPVVGTHTCLRRFDSEVLTCMCLSVAKSIDEAADKERRQREREAAMVRWIFSCAKSILGTERTGHRMPGTHSCRSVRCAAAPCTEGAKQRR